MLALPINCNNNVFKGLKKRGVGSDLYRVLTTSSISNISNDNFLELLNNFRYDAHTIGIVRELLQID